jgi:hypothetical protein
MAEKTIYEVPSVTDTVVIPFLTPDADQCLLQNPYMVNNLTIYYIERDFSGGNVTQFDVETRNQDAERAATEAQNAACLDPTQENILEARKLRAQADSMRVSRPVYYNDAVPVAVIGNSSYPAWLSTDTPNALIENVPLDEEGNTVYGHFQYVWNPVGMREGNYIACWTWTPLAAGETLSQNLSFSLMGNNAITTSIPTHATPPEKYQTLLDTYLPEMYKSTLSEDDVTPSVLTRFNKSVGQGFTVLENLANQILDIMDANSTDEAFLGLLGRMFGLKLRSEDPTRWRKQIKLAVPLYKMKGTRAGLEMAFDLAGMRMTSLVRGWQIISPYTWVETFKAAGGEMEFVLSRVAQPIDSDNFEVSVRKAGNSYYTDYLPSDVSINTSDGVSTLTIENNISLENGDILRVLYQYAAIPNPTQQDIEDYIRLLPLTDQRDETVQDYPPKNWNVRLLEENDPLFSILIPNKHPYHDFLVFGKIRTEFPYSENVYNMDEYNGSIRDSLEPCDMDKDFVDPCSQCLGSKYIIDIEVDRLCDDRVNEAKDILKEFVPFHALPQTINFSGSMEDFVQPPVETIECLIYYRGSETVIAGSDQMVFNRAMIPSGMPLDQILRNTLATSTLVASGTATAYNRQIMLFSPDVPISNTGLSTDPTETVLEIYGPHPHAGNYQVTNAVGHAVEVYGPISPTSPLTEPINQSAFSFSLSNIIYENSDTSIVTDNFYKLKDATWDLAELGVKSQWDVDNGYATTAWTIKMTAYSATPYTIQDIKPEGEIVIAQDPSLPNVNATGVAYSIIRPDASVAHTGTLNLSVELRGLVTVTDGVLTDVRGVMIQPLAGQYFLYYNDTGDQYVVSELVDGETHQFYINGWSGGSVGGKSIALYDRLIDTRYGLLTYQGIGLNTVINYESSLGISNGQNPVLVPLEDSKFKENFIVVINDPVNGADEETFAIADIDGTTITLDGDIHYWTTLGNGGTSVPFEIYNYETLPVTVAGVPFQRLDRRNSEVITSVTETMSPMAMSMAAAPEPGFSDFVKQEEKINFRIDYADGTVEEGSL